MCLGARRFCCGGFWEVSQVLIAWMQKGAFFINHVRKNKVEAYCVFEHADWNYQEFFVKVFSFLVIPHDTEFVEKVGREKVKAGHQMHRWEAWRVAQSHKDISKRVGKFVTDLNLWPCVQRVKAVLPLLPRYWNIVFEPRLTPRVWESSIVKPCCQGTKNTPNVSSFCRKVLDDHCETKLGSDFYIPVGVELSIGKKGSSLVSEDQINANVDEGLIEDILKNWMIFMSWVHLLLQSGDKNKQFLSHEIKNNNNKKAWSIY